jgi:hypothetical protein
LEFRLQAVRWSALPEPREHGTPNRLAESAPILINTELQPGENACEGEKPF